MYSYNAYRAVFADGYTKSRKTPHTYTHAWRLDLSDGRIKIGFSRTESDAYKGLVRAQSAWKTSSGWDIVPVQTL